MTQEKETKRDDELKRKSGTITKHNFIKVN